jgi:valyl-tRNA synthetase
MSRTTPEPRRRAAPPAAGPPEQRPAERARYDPAEAEPRWAAAWLASGALAAEPDDPGEPYSIAVPPPNVTGALHIGHALNGTIQDVLIRRHRMAGYATRWICGTDHAGIATQAMVEKALAAKGVSRADLGRDEFERRVWAWREEYGGTIIEQFKRMGFTLDYAHERFTMDEAYVRAVTRVFVALHRKGYIFRDRYMVNWDPGLRSAVSDLEVTEREVSDTLVSIAYPLADGSGEIEVATVRPETMLGDTGVAVNPDDERYLGLVGRTAVLPLVGRELPIVADEHVDPAFGTGAIKVTPGHDPVDFEIGRRHGLPEILVIGEDGLMTREAGVRYAGLTPAECAHRVVEDLAAAGALRGEEPYTHAVPHSERSGARIEPLVSLQWFCDMSTIARPAIASVEEGRVRFHPGMPHTKVYLEWMRNIRPWCVSRQLWWGHRIPAWYRDGEAVVAEEPPAGEGWERDPDVLDTWFSSALWPFATLGWPEDTPELRRFYPTDVLVTGRDIIFLWVARMLMLGLEFTGREPFGDVAINSIIQAPDGRRMSKSLGTGVDPLDVVAEHGADALRFGLLIMASGQDVRWSTDRVQQGRQLVTKLWNATRLVAERGGRADAGPAPERLADRWICSRARGEIERADALVADFELSAVADLVYHLIFDDYCDWYLELVKAGHADTAVAGAVLEALLALAHPLMPFITEECWARLPGSDGLMLTHAPPAAPGARDEEAERRLAEVREDVRRCRAERSERGVAPRSPLRVRLPAGRDEEQAAALVALAGPLTLDEPTAGPTTEVSADVDPATEARRLRAELNHAERELGRARGRLADKRFVARAPAGLVEAEREKERRWFGEVETIAGRLGELEGAG